MTQKEKGASELVGIILITIGLLGVYVWDGFCGELIILGACFIFEAITK